MHYLSPHWARLIAPLLLALTPAAWAALACSPEPISFAFFESGLLYSEKTRDGIDKAVVEELARRSKCQFDYSFKPRARIWLEMERGDLMMTGSAIRTEEREAYAWGVNYFGLKAEVMINNANGNAPKTREEFLKDDSLKMGVARAFKHGEAMDSFIEELRLRNRVADVPQFSTATDWFPADKSVPRAMLFSKKHFSKAQVQEWRVLLQQMRDDGTLKKIYTSYAGKETAEKLMQYGSDTL